MSDNTILAELERLAAEHEAEAKKYWAAVAVLRGTTPPTPKPESNAVTTETRTFRVIPRRQKSGPTSTMSMIRSTLTSEPTYAADLVQKMLAGGWDTQSTNPQNTARTALGRLVDAEEVIRHNDGRFSLRAMDVRAADDEEAGTDS